ncbi:MAG: hypothetical protein KBC50_02335 [Candidatus Pacebacteria bacterium]|nr:hypothetical protein [Candidatus Paceibacterota bacterium]
MSFEVEVWPHEVFATEEFMAMMKFSGSPKRPEFKGEKEGGIFKLFKVDGTHFSFDEVQWMLDPLRMSGFFKLDQSLNRFLVSDGRGKSWLVDVIAVVDDGHINYIQIDASAL